MPRKSFFFFLFRGVSQFPPAKSYLLGTNFLAYLKPGRQKLRPSLFSLENFSKVHFIDVRETILSNWMKYTAWGIHSLCKPPSSKALGSCAGIIFLSSPTPGNWFRKSLSKIFNFCKFSSAWYKINIEWNTIISYSLVIPMYLPKILCLVAVPIIYS